jgi:hypothetical protein
VGLVGTPQARDDPCCLRCATGPIHGTQQTHRPVRQAVSAAVLMSVPPGFRRRIVQDRHELLPGVAPQSPDGAGLASRLLARRPRGLSGPGAIKGFEDLLLVRRPPDTPSTSAVGPAVRPRAAREGTPDRAAVLRPRPWSSRLPAGGPSCSRRASTAGSAWCGRRKWRHHGGRPHRTDRTHGRRRCARHRRAPESEAAESSPPACEAGRWR